MVGPHFEYCAQPWTLFLEMDGACFGSVQRLTNAMLEGGFVANLKVAKRKQ